MERALDKKAGKGRTEIKRGLKVNPQELSEVDYYAGLSTWDAHRVKMFVHLVRTASDGKSGEYGVMAYGSTTRPNDRRRANDIDLKVLSPGKARTGERDVAVRHIIEAIRNNYTRLRIPFAEHPQTFRWGGSPIYHNDGYGISPSTSGIYQVPNEDPSFVVESDEIPALPLHISVNGVEGFDVNEWLKFEKSGDRSLAVLLEPAVQSPTLA